MRGSRIKIFLLVLLFSCIQFGIWLKIYNDKVKSMNTQVDTLNAQIEEIGPAVTCYTVKGSVYPGKEIKESDLEPIQVAQSRVGKTYVTDTSKIVGKQYKIGVSNGTPLTTDLVMSNKISDTTREVDLCVSYWTVGLKEGDYVDLRLTLPYGDDYLVISKARVEQVNSVTFKTELTEEQWQTYKGAMVDYYLNSGKGASIYVTKYVEPGVQEAAIPYYSVPDNVRAVMVLDPNILNKAIDSANASLRSTIKNVLDGLKTENDTLENDESALQKGASDTSTKINTDYESKKQADDEKKDEAVANGETTDTTEPSASPDAQDKGNEEAVLK